MNAAGHTAKAGSEHGLTRMAWIGEGKGESCGARVDRQPDCKEGLGLAVRTWSEALVDTQVACAGVI